MVSGLGTVYVIILEVSHFDKSILDRGWMVALDLCRKEKKKNDSNTPSITLGHPPGAPVILWKGPSIKDVGTFFTNSLTPPSPMLAVFDFCLLARFNEIWPLPPPTNWRRLLLTVPIGNVYNALYSSLTRYRLGFYLNFSNTSCPSSLIFRPFCGNWSNSLDDL